ncbi:MAG: nitrate- and nitrite sensing domain-containing protein [Magnetococcales bacterium]|nr:nitrate- and nitrite sensing domain-containing protein [Magnetococcales bacterium]
MQFLKNLSLKAKFSVMLLIPLIGLLWFSSMSLLFRYELSTNMETVGQLSQLAVKISSLLHETQKERGMTAGYLGSKGKNFARKLPEHRRENSDRRISELNDFLKTFKASDYDSQLASALSDGLQDLNNISNIRRQVDGQSIPAGKAIGFYTNMNATFLKSIGRIPALADNMEMSYLTNAYTNFLLGKERAGIERAVMTNTFARNGFGNGMLRKFNVLVTEQDTFTKVFLSFANKDLTSFYNNKLSGRTVDSVNQMRNIGFKQGIKGDFGIDPQAWFRTSSARINLLKEVEDRISTDIIALATQLKESAKTVFLIYLVATIATVLLALFFGISIAKEIFSQVGGEPTVVAQLVQRITEGDLVGRCNEEDLDPNTTGILRDINNLSLKLCTILRGLGYISKDLNAASEDLDTVVSGMAEGTAVMQDRTELTLQNARHMDTDIEAISNASTQNSTDLGTVSDMATQTDSNLHTIAAAAEEANANLGSVTSATELTSDNMIQVDDAAKRTNENVDVVSDSVQSIATSFANVQKLCEEASKSSQQASIRAKNGTEIMEKLSEAAHEIKSVVAVINRIADQTNMLALNASIEAAGAGEAGKGFAVVANEVKELASQTGDSTQMISDKIQAIQTLTNDATGATSEVTDSIELISQANEEILRTVDEQNKAVEEIATSIGTASKETGQVTSLIEDSTKGISEVTRNMGELSLAVTEVTQNVAEASRSTGEMSNNVAQVTEASAQISDRITETANISKTISASMDEMKGSVDDISQMSQTVADRSTGMRKLADQLVDILGQFRM